jgi:AbrB family looped-hinge helix DNA binding protein
MKMEGVVTSKGQLVIPAELRRVFRIGKGTKVRFARIKGGIAVYPNYEDSLNQVRGIAAGLGILSRVDRDPDRELR